MVRAHGLGKQYRVDRVEPYRTFRDVVARSLSYPFRRMRSPHREDTLWALRNVSFELREGDVVGVIGRNGAGKTTLLRILSRITPPNEGHAVVAGRVGSLLEVGTGFHPELTGRENVYLNGAILGMRKREMDRKLDEIVAFAEVERFLETPVKRYSTGMQVRLAFAVAAHLETEILLVDEVLAVGDLAFQRKCLAKMDEAGSHGRTVIFVTHNMGSVTRLCRSGLLLDHGHLVAQGPIQDVVDCYISLNREAPGERRWIDLTTAPGNEVARIKTVRVVSENRASGDVRIDRDVWVEIEFVNYKAGAHLAPGLHLLDHSRHVVLASANMPSVSASPDEWGGKAYPAGTFRSRCRIPANFLNEGRYVINALIMVDHRGVEAIAPEAITFSVHETGEMRREFDGRWIGSVRPRLEWQTERAPDSSHVAG